MEINQLKQFQIIAKTQNLSLVAKELYISQPALSIMLQRRWGFITKKDKALF